MHRTSRQLIAAAAVAGGALLWCWFLLTKEPDPIPRRALGSSARAAGGPDNPSATAAVWPARGTAALRERLREPADRWLHARGRDAAGLLAIWDLGGDPAILAEAARNFPDDPIVCRAMVEANTGDISTALVWIEKLITLQPENSDGYYLKTWALLASGQTVEALDALRAATAHESPRDPGIWRRATNLGEVALACGLAPREAALAPLQFIRDQDLVRRFLDCAANDLGILMDQARAIGDPDTVASLGRTALVAALNQGFLLNFPATLTDEMALNRFNLSMIKHLPEDWQYAPAAGSFTAAHWKESARQRSMALADARTIAQLAAALLQLAPDEVVAEYAQLFLVRGEEEANTWLLAQPAPAPSVEK